LQPFKTYLNWSSGKDSALALHYLLRDKKYRVGHLITTINSRYDRVSMHGLRKELLLRQAEALGISLGMIELPEEPSMEEYETIMKRHVLSLQRDHYDCAAFGDIFLEDLKKYREDQLAPYDMKVVFPLWKKDTVQLLHEFIQSGFKAIVVCVNSRMLDSSFAGRLIDMDFIKDLPSGVDACGENGEYHTFCFDGPVFKKPVLFDTGEKIFRQYRSPDNINGAGPVGFWFCDLVPAGM
jgi:uncharacterized protein (TIGR00290 family)